MTKVIRRRPEETIGELIINLKHSNVLDFCMFGRLPKLDGEIPLSILRKIFKCKAIRDFESGRGGRVYYRAAGGEYFNVITDKPTGVSSEKYITVNERVGICLALSSSVFWLYQQAYADGLNLKLFEVQNFPVPDFSALSSADKSALEVLWTSYRKDVEAHARIRNVSQNNVNFSISRFKEYKIVFSKPIIDKIDEVIGRMYGLSEEEISFLKSYELEFRMSGDGEFMHEMAAQNAAAENLRAVIRRARQPQQIRRARKTRRSWSSRRAEMSGKGRELRARSARGRTRGGGGEHCSAQRLTRGKTRGKGRGWRATQGLARVKARGRARLARELAGLAAVIANRRGGFAAEGGGDGVNAETALARELFGFCDLREGRKHQQLAVGAGVEVIAARFEIGAEAAGNNRNQGKPRFANGAGDGLFARRNAARDDHAAAVAEENCLFGFCGDFSGCGTARDLDEQLVGRFGEKGVADSVAGGWKVSGECRAGRGWQNPSGRGWQNPSGRGWQNPSGRDNVGLRHALSERAADELVKVDRAGNLEEIGVLHNGPATLGVAQGVAGHALQLAFAKENRVVEPWEPEGCRAIDFNRHGQGEIGLGAGDLETSDDLAEWGAQAFVNPDDAVEVLGHYGVLAGLDFREDLADLFPGRGDGDSEGRGNELTVFNIAENGAATLHDQGDHVKPGSAIIPTGQAYAGFEVAVFVAFAIHFVLPFFSFCAQGAQGRTPEYARHNPGRARRGQSAHGGGQGAQGVLSEGNIDILS